MIPLPKIEDVYGSSNTITIGCIIQIAISVTMINNTNFLIRLSFPDRKVKFLFTKKLVIKAMVVEQ